MTTRLEEIKKRALLLSSPNNPCCAVGEECNKQLHEDMKHVFRRFESAQKVIEFYGDRSNWGKTIPKTKPTMELDGEWVMKALKDRGQKARDWLKDGK